MFGNSNAFGSFSVDDPARAKQFYAETLGLEVTSRMMDGYEILSLQLPGGGTFIVYPKPDHRPATFTVLNFPVPDLQKAMQELKARGVRFERYDTDPVKTDEDGVFRGGGPLIAWFRDPAGNVLSVLEEPR